MQPAGENKPTATQLAMENGVINPAQANQWKAKLTVMKYKIVAAIVLGLAFLAGTVLIAYIGLSNRNSGPQIQMFQFVLRDSSALAPIYLDVKVDPKEKVEYLTSPEVDKNGNGIGEIQGIRDDKNGIEAFISNDNNKCFIVKIAPTENTPNFENGSIHEGAVDANMTFYLLNQTIHPYILNTLAGKNVVAFCGSRDGVWMIPFNQTEVNDSDEDSSESSRKRRFACWSCGGGNNFGYRCWWSCSGWGWYRRCYRYCSYY